MTQGCLLSAALKKVPLKMLSEGWLLSNKVAHLCLLFCFVQSKVWVGGVNMLIKVDEMNGIKENKSFHSLEKRVVF